MVSSKNEVAFMILSSSREQDTIAAVPKILSKIFPQNMQGTRLLYHSQEKIHALEDCVQFVPHLFRLSKSIMVAEPVNQIGEIVKSGFTRDSYLQKLARDFDQKTSANEKKLNPSLVGKQVSTHYCERGGLSVQRKLAGYKKQQMEDHEREAERVTLEVKDVDDNESNWSEESWVQRARKRKTLTQKMQKERKT